MHHSCLAFASWVLWPSRAAKRFLIYIGPAVPRYFGLSRSTPRRNQETRMRPSIFGYVRIVGRKLPSDDDDVKRELASHAERTGFLLDRVFTECVRLPDSAFSSMLAALKDSDIKDVIVPSLWHFAQLPGLQDAMRRHVELETGARIWIANGPEHSCTVASADC